MTRSRTLAALLASALVAAVVVTYLPVLGFPFVGYDDDRRLLAVPAIRSGLSWPSIVLAFTSVWDANWSPLTWISHMLDFSLYANDAGAHHRTNLVLHALNVLLLFGALRETTGATWRPAVVAGLLAVHPIHVESVAWISERKGLLSSTFALLSIWGYLRYGRTGRAGPRIASLAFLALGLLCKSMLVTLPLLFLLLDYWPLGRLGVSGAARKAEARALLAMRVREKWPFFAVVALAALGALGALGAQSLGGAVRGFEGLPLGARLANALVSTVEYLGHLAWPAGLAVFYPHRSLPGGPGHGVLQVLAAGALLAGVTLAVLRTGPPPLRTGWLWYLVALGPVSGIVQIGSQSMADRYAYLPAIGLYFGVTWALADLLARAGPQARRAALAAVVAVLILAGVAARRQVWSWESSEALFRHAIANTHANYSMHYNLANVLKSRGRIEESIAEYRNAIAIFPGMGRAHFNLANTLLGEGRTPEAVRHYRAAAEAMPGVLAPWQALGRALVRQGDLHAALAHYERDVALRPDSVESHGTYAHLLRMAGRLPEAIREYEAAARLAPRDGAWQRNVDEVRALQDGEAAGRTAAGPSSQAADP